MGTLLRCLIQRSLLVSSLGSWCLCAQTLQVPPQNFGLRPRDPALIGVLHTVHLMRLVYRYICLYSNSVFAVISYAYALISPVRSVMLLMPALWPISLVLGCRV